MTHSPPPDRHHRYKALLVGLTIVVLLLTLWTQRDSAAPSVFGLPIPAQDSLPR